MRGLDESRGGNDGKLAVYYTRCPVPSATGIAVQTGIFDRLLAHSRYALRDIAELGVAHANAHYTHSVERCFREGGGSPPVWARARGADTRLLGITFMDETQGVFVRQDDPAQGMHDLCGRRIGLPLWPKLIFNFWRFAAEKGFHSALRCHGLRKSDVIAVDVVEGGDRTADASLGIAASDLRQCNYGGQLRALLDGRVDAIFGKGVELALLERVAGGKIRLLYDLTASAQVADRVNNSTPRLVTVSARLVNEDREVVVLYLQGLLRAAAWATRHALESRNIIARECAVEARAVDSYLCAGYANRLMPATTPELLDAVQILKAFLFERGYLAGDFDLADWVDPQPLREASAREQAEGG